MDPGPGGTLAGILPPRYWLAAAAAALSGRPGSVILPSGRVNSDTAEPDRAGAGHGQPGTTWAEVVQMRLTYPLADRHPLPAVPPGIPACAAIPAHARQPRAGAQALALSHRDPLQSVCGLAFLIAGPYGHLTGKIERRTAAPSARRYRWAGLVLVGPACGAAHIIFWVHDPSATFADPPAGV